MDRLVKADVKELELAFKRGQRCTATFRLSNLMHTMSVAISLTTTKPSLYSFDQCFSIIPPLSTSTYTLILSLPIEDPSLPTHPDTIAVKSSMLPIGKANQDHLRRLFSKPGPHIFKDATIPIYLVGAQVIDFLISQHDQIPQISSFFNRAVSGCTTYQLSLLLKNAVASGNEYFVTSLIDHGADPDIRDADGRSMICLAVKTGNVNVVKELIASGCQIDDSIDRVLHEAASMNRVDLLELLINSCNNSIDVDSVDSYGRSSIHVAAIKGRTRVIHFLVTICGAKTNGLDKNGSSPLHLAAENGHLEAVKLLLDSSDYIKNAVNRQGKTAFDLAVENCHAHLYEALHHGDSLQRAARVGNVDVIRNCLAEGARVNGRDQNGWTPLHRAAFKGRIESVKVLISHGANIEAVDYTGYTPLHCAVMAGQVEVALLLISRGAQANWKSVKQLIPLKLDQFNCHPSLMVQPPCQKEQA